MAAHVTVFSLLGLELAHFIRLWRVGNFIFPLLGVVVGFLVSGSHQYAQLLLLSVVAFILHSGVNVINDLEDMEIDATNGRDYVLKIRNMSRYHQYWAASIGMVIASLIVSLSLPVVTAVLMCCLVIVSWLYNSKPVQASRRPLLSVIVLNVAGGLLPFLLGLSLGSIEWFGLGFAIIWSIGRMSLTVLKDYKDAIGDARHNKKTFLLVYGGTKVAYTSMILAAIGWVGCVVLLALGYGIHPLTWVLAIICLWLFVRRAGLLERRSYAALHAGFIEASQYQVLFDVGVIACLLH